jgi:SHS2 domain-containing protein
VFEQGFEAMRELLGDAPDTDEGAGGPAVKRRIALQGSDRAVLLADWLAELAYLAETEGLVPWRLPSLELTETGLQAVVEGTEGTPPHLVKAATYHRLALETANGRWRATVVLDV